MDNPRHATGPVRPSTRKREKKASSKPYARPEGKASTTTVDKDPSASPLEKKLLKTLFNPPNKLVCESERCMPGFATVVVDGRNAPMILIGRAASMGTLRRIPKTTIPEGIHSVMGPRGMTAMSASTKTLPHHRSRRNS
jgi:hypothetical protein